MTNTSLPNNSKRTGKQVLTQGQMKRFGTYKLDAQYSDIVINLTAAKNFFFISHFPT